ncbi:hypothetical protein [Geothrix sp. 21YS21S-4]|uniref:hypothetical protein n=1 Tax=Geothrix sp. 21YS21S-4 TaxID=3068889 RepID=UPI0027B91F73|nr:hypothetical protein [Geothrix sp. 21YS21S-4]
MRFFGAHRFAVLADLGGDEAASFHLLRRESDGGRFVAQIWTPRPSDRDLDQLREAFLARFLDAAPVDPEAAHLGFDDHHAWHLQALHGAPLSRLWPGWDPETRDEALRRVDASLVGNPHPRFLHPDAITFLPGLIQIPRLLGEPAQPLIPLSAALAALPPGPLAPEDPPWRQTRALSAPVIRPLRGRGREMTYLKSLMLGLSAPASTERIVLLQGEEGVGKGHLAAWGCAVAESEGTWVHSLGISPGESAGRFLRRLLESLLAGGEAEFYARNPEAARLLAPRLPAFAFLADGRPLHPTDSSPDPEEVEAAAAALEAARLQHPRLIRLSGLEQAAPEVLALLRELIRASDLPWLLSLTTGDAPAGLRPLVADLRGEASAALVGVDRLEDPELARVLDDLLVSHELPQDYVDGLVARSLGNPGLLRNLLELAQQEGALAWDDDRWRLHPGAAPPQVAEDLLGQVFRGRLQRLSPAPATLIRLLALAERPLPLDTLASLVGLGEESLEDAMEEAFASRLVRLRRGEASLSDPAWRDLVLAGVPSSTLKGLALVLLPVIQRLDGTPARAVALHALAVGDSAALAALMASLDDEAPPPIEVATRMVEQALRLHPRPWDEARLHEHLAEAWARGTPPMEALIGPPQAGALESLDRALAALSQAEAHGGARLAEARIHRKRALLLLHLRRVGEAQQALGTAAERLADHPLHPEQARLRLACGRLHLFQGHLAKGIRALEEGLRPRGEAVPDPDETALLTTLGRALIAQGQFQRAAAHLQSLRRALEHARDFRALVPVQVALAQVHLVRGEGDACVALLREALHTARLEGDPALQAEAHLALGMARSLQQLLEPALVHLDRALERAQRVGDAPRAAVARLWRARTLAALGDPVAADHALFQASVAPALLSPEERGDFSILEGDIARFRGAWKEAARCFKAAADHFEAAGMLWRHRLAQLHLCQALAREVQGAGGTAPGEGWTILESLKGPVEGSGSRWLDLEWHRAHALLLTTVPASEPVAEEGLRAWGEVLAAARDLQFPAPILEASAEGALLLLQRGEKLGARARLQDAFPSFQQMWSRVPPAYETSFLGREDLRRFRRTVEAAGLQFVLPERVAPLMDWTPTQVLTARLADLE